MLIFASCANRRFICLRISKLCWPIRGLLLSNWARPRPSMLLFWSLETVWNFVWRFDFVAYIICVSHILERAQDAGVRSSSSVHSQWRFKYILTICWVRGRWFGSTSMMDIERPLSKFPRRWRPLLISISNRVRCPSFCFSWLRLILSHQFLILLDTRPVAVICYVVLLFPRHSCFAK
jgi:hypothetical protein